MTVISALWRASHPGPTVVVTAVAGGLAWASGRPQWQVAAVIVAVACGQLSVGWSNDAIDADRDLRSSRADKPVVAGAVTRPVVFAAAAVAAVVTVPLSLLIGARGLWHVLAVAAAWLYNRPLKRTAWSVLPFGLAFGALVVYAVAKPQPWLVVAGGCLGAAAHFANVLPDLTDDAANGVHGLPHRLGAKASQVSAALLLLTAALLAAVELSAVVAGLVLGVAVLLAAAMVAVPPSRTVFRLVMAAALIDVAALLVAVGT